MVKYKITLTENQMRVVQNSLEEWFCLRMGQDGDFYNDLLIAENIWNSIRCARGQNRWGMPLQMGSEPCPKVELTESAEDEDDSVGPTDAEKL